MEIATRHAPQKIRNSLYNVADMSFYNLALIERYRPFTFSQVKGRRSHAPDLLDYEWPCMGTDLKMNELQAVLAFILTG